MEQTLKQFANGNLYSATDLLFSKLGIKHTQEEPTPICFQDYYESRIPQYIQNALALTTELYYIGEVCDDVLQGNTNNDSGLAEDLEKLRANAHYQSMMLFSVDLREDCNVTRTNMAVLTRAFNSLVYNFPVTIIFRQGHLLSIGTCERTEFKQEWRQGQGEKLGKVCLLRNVDCLKPHRGHLDILQAIGDKQYNSFDKLYEQWKEVFSSKLLTERFYSELQNWYFWAVKHVSFPNNIDDNTDDQLYNKENVIRLITRLMFVWFLKQKHLVNPDLFDEEKLRNILKDFDPLSDSSNYYVGIIQNLFFATLNQEIDRRQFVKDGKDPNHHNIKTYYRNKRLFVDENDERIISLFNQSPYVNGSLFECLDDKHYDGETFYWDGFSQHKHFKNGQLKQAVVPNYLFFTKEDSQEVDMKTEYGKNSTFMVRVSGLLTILTKYQFTIEENTPLDEDVALDPELLGRAFENLLGAFNPETQKTARKNTGSYYTPRDIVNYMVRESLMSHFMVHCPSVPSDMLDSILDYNLTEKPKDITEKQVKEVVDAVYHCRILDPACGSGAFLMGVLQMLVQILRKLDGNNKYWYKIVMDQAMEELKRLGIWSDEERQRLSNEITRTFEEKVNDPDYTRKLYIIEKCIYGSDIQPVAVQISRLRCFISLLCEQPTNNDPAKNYGIKPLPNLETNFVASNTLMTLKLTEEEESLLREDEVTPLITQLREVRHLLFMPRDNQAKKRLKAKDEKIRQLIDEKIQDIYNRRLADAISREEANIAAIEAQLASMGDIGEEDTFEEITEQDLFGNITTKKVKKVNPKTELIAYLNRARSKKQYLEYNDKFSQIIDKIRRLISWDPFNQNIYSKFFEPEWMFGVTEGFDIVIGNPPYIQLQADKGKLANLYAPCGFETFNRGGDIYCLFYERGNQLLKNEGTLCYITSNKWMRAGYGSELRNFLTTNTNPKHLIDFGETHVFESATVMTNILLFQKGKNENKIVSTQIKEDFSTPNMLQEYVGSHSMPCKFEGDESWVIMSDLIRNLKRKVESHGTTLDEWNIEIFRGVLTGYNQAFIISTEVRNEILNNCKDREERKRTEQLICPMLRGKDVRKYGHNWSKWLISTFPSRRYEIDDYPAVKQFLLSFGMYKLEQTGIKHIVDGNEIKARKKTHGKWFETQDSIAYWEQFAKPKIIYPNMTKFMPFYYDERGFFSNDKSFIITGNHTSFLVAFFNSSLFKFCFFDDFPVLFGGARELRKMFVEKIPVLEVTDAIDAEFRELVLDIQKEYSDEKAKAIDQRIFDLYGLTQEERDAIGYIDFHNINDNETDDDE